MVKEQQAHSNRGNREDAWPCPGEHIQNHNTTYNIYGITFSSIGFSLATYQYGRRLYPEKLVRTNKILKVSVFKNNLRIKGQAFETDYKHTNYMCACRLLISLKNKRQSQLVSCQVNQNCYYLLLSKMCYSSIQLNCWLVYDYIKFQFKLLRI